MSDSARTALPVRVLKAAGVGVLVVLALVVILTALRTELPRNPGVMSDALGPDHGEPVAEYLDRAAASLGDEVVGGGDDAVAGGGGAADDRDDDNDTPSLAISLLPEYRGKGIGTRLLNDLLLLLQENGYRRASLSVQKENPALCLYQRAGFRIAAEKGTEYLMLWDAAQAMEQENMDMDAEKQRESKIQQWFSMWLDKADTGIEDLFATDAVYIESWGPEYHGSGKIQLWFDEWNTRGTVEHWDI